MGATISSWGFTLAKVVVRSESDEVTPHDHPEGRAESHIVALRHMRNHRDIVKRERTQQVEHCVNDAGIADHSGRMIGQFCLLFVKLRPLGKASFF